MRDQYELQLVVTSGGRRRVREDRVTFAAEDDTNACNLVNALLNVLRATLGPPDQARAPRNRVGK